MNTNTLSSHAFCWFPSTSRVWLRGLSVLTAALLTALAAQIVIPLPHTPVPMTLQSLMVLLTGALLGPSLGAASMGLYLLAGAAGLPVFSMGRGGLEVLTAGVTGGYLIGFLVAQPLIGSMTRVGPRYTLRLAGAILAAQLIIFVCGVTWFGLMQHLRAGEALSLALYPFLGDLAAKCVLAFGIARAAGPTVRRVLGTR